MKKTVLLIILLTILSKIFGFGREITLSYFYGASSISDAYLISLTIPVTLFAFVGMGIATSYIPIYSNIVKENSITVADTFTNNIISFILIICTGVVLVSSIFTEPIVKLFASGFEGETLKLAIRFTRISLYAVYLSGLIYVFSSYLQLKNNFIVPAIIGVPLNIITIISIMLSSASNKLILPIGTLIAAASQLILMVPFAHKIGYRYKLIYDRYDPYLKKMVYLSLPVLIGVSVNQINVLVDRTIASRIVIGGISALTYANRLNLFIQGTFVMSLATVMYPMISKMAAEGNMEGLKKSLSEVIVFINLLVLPATVGTMIFAEPVVKLLFGRGAFDSQAIALTSCALVFYSIGMVGFGLREILARVFYSMQDTKTPMINAVIGVVLNIILNIILSKYMGISGLALATSIAAIFTTGSLFISLRKKIGPFGMKQVTISFLKILLASLIMGVILKLFYNLFLFFISENISLIISIVLGSTIYILTIYFMKIDDVRVIMNSVKGKIKRSAK